MMKEICAQCLQPHRDPVTGKVSYVFSCFNQDQPLDLVDFPGLAARLTQNSVQEKVTGSGSGGACSAYDSATQRVAVSWRGSEYPCGFRWELRRNIVWRLTRVRAASNRP